MGQFEDPEWIWLKIIGLFLGLGMIASVVFFALTAGQD